MGEWERETDSYPLIGPFLERNTIIVPLEYEKGRARQTDKR
jgi:hypothetical protein